MRFTNSQTSFQAGRLSPKLSQRIDTNQYKDGCSVLNGMRVLPEGGVERVRGTRTLATDSGLIIQNGFGQGPASIKQFSLLVGEIPLLFEIYEEFPSIGTYGQVRLRGYKTNGYKLESIGTIQLTPEGGTKYLADLFDYAYSDGVLVITHFSGTFAPRFITLDKTTPVLDYAALQSLDPSASNSLPVDYRRFPMSDIGSTGTSLAIAKISATVISATGTTADIEKITGSTGWIYLEGLGSRDFGDGAVRTFVVSGWYRVVSNPSTTVVHLQCNSNVNGTDPILFAISPATTTTISLWTYSIWGTNDWPRTVCSHEGRIVFGGTRTKPLTVFGSRINQITQFNQLRLPETGTDLFNVNGILFGTTLVTDPYQFTIASDEDARIHFVRGMGALAVGTDRKEWVLTGGDTVLSALSVDAKPQSTQGSVPLSAVQANKGLYYLSNDGHRLFSFRYNESNGSLMSTEIGLLINDILEEDPIVEMCWAPHINSIMLVLKSGSLWGIMDTGREGGAAPFNTNLTAIESICFINTGTGDAIYPRGSMLAMYSHNYGRLSFEQVYYEYGVNASFITTYGLAEENAYLFMDNLTRIRTISSSGGTKFSFINQELTGVAVSQSEDKVLVPKPLFPDGKITFINYDTRQAISLTATVFESKSAGLTAMDYWVISDSTVNFWTDFFVGKPMAAAEVATMPLEVGQQWGTAQMGIKNIDTIGVRHYKTYSYEFSSDRVKWQEAIVATTDGKVTTGRADKKFTTSPDTDQIIYLRNTKAEPLTVLGINFRGVSNDG